MGAPSVPEGITDPLAPMTGSRLRATMGAPGMGGPPPTGGAAALALAIVHSTCLLKGQERARQRRVVSPWVKMPGGWGEKSRARDERGQNKEAGKEKVAWQEEVGTRSLGGRPPNLKVRLAEFDKAPGPTFPDK